MAQVEPVAGRRRAGSPKKRPRNVAKKPAKQRQAPALPANASRTLWLALLAVATGGLVAAQTSGLPDLVRQVSAIVLTGTLACGLAVRVGGRTWWATGLAAGLATLAFVIDWGPLLAGTAIGTGVIAGILAVMATTPAANFGIAIREALVATAIGGIGAVGVQGYGVGDSVGVDATRFGYVVLAFAVLGCMALVFRLGAGWHGLGRRGYFLIFGAVLMLAIALAYSEAFAHWGSRDLVNSMDDFRANVRSHLHAVPHPIAALLGYPALVWGVFMRARRRQGWWVCAFGVAATASATTRLVDPTVSLSATLLGAAYSLIVGLVLGYVAIRVEQALTGTRGRRARRTEEALAHRPEPGRTQPLH